MEIQLRNVARLASTYDVMRAIAKVLHCQAFVVAYYPNQPRLFNFLVHLDADDVPNSIRNGGTGTLTLPSPQLGKNFITFLRLKKRKVKVLGQTVHFFPSSNVPQAKLIHVLKKVPYQDPDIVEARERIIKELIFQLPVSTLQFGVFFRQPPRLVYSPEWEQDYRERGDARLKFEYEHKLLRLKTGDHSDSTAYSVVITFVNLKRIFIGWDLGNPFILFHLTTPPALESEDMYRQDTGRARQDNENSRRRVGYFDEAHARIAPYAHQIRLILKDGANLKQFKGMCQKAGILIPIEVPEGSVDVQRLQIFSSQNLRKIDTWLTKLDWHVAFQCSALLHNLRLNALDLLKLQPHIDALAKRGPQFASRALRHYHTVLRSLHKDETIITAFTRAVQELESLDSIILRADSSCFDAHHIIFTPTAIRLEGPFAHRSNRIIRQYSDHQEFFVHVAFRNEDRLQYRWDREVDGASFVRERVGQILHHGFKIAGRKFDFLGYSQSQLRAHSVIAVSPFEHPQKGLVSALTIREEVGVFNNILNYPALYAARVSQAFSATEDSVWLRADEWDEMPDVKLNGRVFTDGVGTISPELGEKIWQKLCEQRHRTPSMVCLPVAYQIRFGGCKGMVCVDPRLPGVKMRLRPSMRKFDVHRMDSMPLEIARAFDYPGPMYLNRPLIQILEDLGIPQKIFLTLQDAAVESVQTARNSLSNFANLLDTHSLGKAFSLSNLVRSLEQIGYDLNPNDSLTVVGASFIRGLADTAVLSVLRDLKHSARIPVPQAWVLPGVADEGDVLGPGQIYACIWERGAEHPTFLEGLVMISRSPTIHPGDVQMVTAIGKPPAGSIFEMNPLPNVVVFPCKGKRDLASCLGGGDLDGDLYAVCQYPGLLVHPQKCHSPGDYPPTQRRDINRPSTIHDVADFVVEYINSDVVGLLSTNHLILSDQSSYGTRDKDCLKLAELCSKAVDYPKSGIPVDMRETPRFLIPYKPDWKSGEVINPRGTDYYESTRAIGVLFRAITLDENMKELSFDTKTSTLGDKPKDSSVEPPPSVDAISSILTPLVETHLSKDDSMENMENISTLFKQYCLQLRYICLTHTLSSDPDIRLREEEIVVGTILAKCTQVKWRKNRVEEMLTNVVQLVRSVSAELGGFKEDEAGATTKSLAMAWAAWKHARANPREFGHHSFGLIALTIIFGDLDRLKSHSSNGLQQTQDSP